MTDENVAFKSPNGSPWKQLDAQEHKQELYTALLNSLQMQHLVVLAGSGCSLGRVGGPSMSDLWKKVVDENDPKVVARVIKQVEHNSGENIESLLSRVEAYLSLKTDKFVEKFLRDSKKKILAECSGFLNDEAGLEAHKTFIHRLSRRRVRDSRLKIFTTNYDLCFERAASALGTVAIDGFSFASPRRFDPRYFSYDIVRRPHNGDETVNYLEGVFFLYKLHGSVNWAAKGNGSIVEESGPSPDEACLIYPASGKYQQSFKQPYLESVSQYMAAVREPNTCVIVAGFGFNDDHLTVPLLEAASSNPHLRLIVVGPSAKSDIEKGEHKHWKRLSELNEQGEDVWFISAYFDQFARLIPDLKALSPADALVKAVRDVARVK